MNGKSNLIYPGRSCEANFSKLRIRKLEYICGIRRVSIDIIALQNIVKVVGDLPEYTELECCQPSFCKMIWGLNTGRQLEKRYSPGSGHPQRKNTGEKLPKRSPIDISALSDQTNKTEKQVVPESMEYRGTIQDRGNPKRK